MHIVTLSSSIVGSKTALAMQTVTQIAQETYPEATITAIDLRDKQLTFADGRHYTETTDDTLAVTNALMQADAIIIGTPIFQASIPGTLKNLFDLLPERAFLDKVVSIVVTAGSSKHYLVAQTQLKPILDYMKAQVLPEIVFIEGTDFHRQTITNSDILFRLTRLVDLNNSYILP